VSNDDFMFQSGTRAMLPRSGFEEFRICTMQPGGTAVFVISQKMRRRSISVAGCQDKLGGKVRGDSERRLWWVGAPAMIDEQL